MLQKQISPVAPAQQFPQRYICFVHFQLKRLENLVNKIGGIETAVDLLYRINYIGSQVGAEQSVLMRSITSNLYNHEINDPECILVDPKLLGGFMICYRVKDSCDITDQDYANLCRLLRKKKGGWDLGPYDGFSSFTVERSTIGLRALWLWQCQKLVLSTLEISSIAQSVELMHNYVQHLILPRDPDLSIVEDKFIEAASHNNFPNLSMRSSEFAKWRQVLSGFECLQGPPKHRPCYSGDPFLPTFEREYQLQQPPRIIKLMPHDLDDLNAEFICSGPFKLEFTDDIRDHLKFKLGDPETILLYHAKRPNPGEGERERGQIFDGNKLAGFHCSCFCTNL